MRNVMKRLACTGDNLLDLSLGQEELPLNSLLKVTRVQPKTG